MSRAANNTKPVTTRNREPATRDMVNAAKTMFDEHHAKSSLHVKQREVDRVVNTIDKGPQVATSGGIYVGIVESLQAELSSVVARNNRIAHVLNRFSGYCEGLDKFDDLEPADTEILSIRLFRVIEGLRRERERANGLLDALEALV